MTDQHLRELLRERVAEVGPTALGPTDPGATAWRRAARTRRRRRTVAVAGAAAAAVAVVAALSVVDGAERGDPDPAPPPATVTDPTPRPSGSSPAAESGGSYGGADVWWAPDVDAEARLPQRDDTPLPRTIELSAGAPEVSDLGHAVAIFWVGSGEAALGRVVVVGADGSSYSLDVGHLEPVADEGGNVFPPISPDSLSPDGRHAIFRQEGALEVYDFATDEWSTIDIPVGDPEFASWTTDRVITVLGGYQQTAGGASYSVDGDLLERLLRSVPTGTELALVEGDEPYGPFVFADGVEAQSHFLSGAVERDGTPQSAEALVAQRGGELDALAFGFERDDRSKACCPAVGWLGTDTLLFESHSAAAHVLAWEVGTPRMSRVAAIRGLQRDQEWYVAAFADLNGDPSFPDGS